MEFKGTKGEWYIDNEESGTNEHGASFLAISSKCGTEKAKGICDVYSSKENAKLIACAPEMLEMLIRAGQWIINSSEEAKIAKDIQELIKKATTI